jgi:nitrogen fixation NifU-like protein
MSDLEDELAREIISDHFRRPRHSGKLGEGPLQLENPSCGDRLSLSLAGEGLVEMSFEGKGCSISQASASMMTELLSGKTREEALALAEEVLSVFRGDSDPQALEALGDIAALSGIARLPVRAKCAALAWQGARTLLKGP